MVPASINYCFVSLDSDRSDMLNCNLFEVLLPVFLETDLLLPLGIELVHDVVEALLEADLEDRVVVVASTHNCLVV